MKLSDAITQLQQFAAKMGPDAEFALWSRDEDRMFQVDPDTEVWEFEILRGDNEVVIEF
jgi:hypothetical protein